MVEQSRSKAIVDPGIDADPHASRAVVARLRRQAPLPGSRAEGIDPFAVLRRRREWVLPPAPDRADSGGAP